MAGSTVAGCARRIRSRAEAEGWGTWRTVTEIRAGCRPTWLAAHRLARGWTLEQAVARLAEIRARRGGTYTAITVQMLNSWERERVVPSLNSIDLLCELYQTRCDRLGFGRDYSPRQPTDTGPADVGPATVDPTSAAPAAQPSAESPGVPPGPVSLPTIMQVRHGLEDLLSAAPEPDVLERWEKAVATHTATARYSLPSVLLDQVVPDFARAQRDLTARYPARHHRQVAHILARLAGIIAYGLMGMAQHKESDAWARTAGTLAAECGDRQLGAWVLARLAMTQFELGSLNTCLAWSRAARLVARDRPCGGVAWAWATESYALARMGRTAEARTALRRTEDLFSRQPTDRESPLFGYGPRTQHMIETTAYARLGDVDRTWAAVAGTHRTLPADHHPVVRSWPDLHLALSLGVATDYRAACEAATRILNDVEGHPVARRIQTGAREILDLLPDGHRDRPYARELRALVRAGGRGA